MSLNFGNGPGGAQGDQQDLVVETSTANFGKDVIEASRDALILVDFWADWCGPCKQLAPVLEKVVSSYAGRVRLVKLNVDQHPAIAGQLRIQSLPTVYAFKDGQPLDGFMGAQPESTIREFVDRLLGPDEAAQLAETLESAQAAFDAGDLQTAAQTYAMILQADAQNPDALAGLAQCYLKSGDIERAKQTIGLVPPDKQNNAAVSAVKATLDLAEHAPEITDTSGLEARIAANPADHQARMDLAMAAAAAGDKETAVEQLLEIFRRDRNWQEEAARKQLLQFFEAWGPKDPQTLEGRRRLSSLLFA